MPRKSKILPSILTVAALIGSFLLALTIFFPEPTQSAQTVESARSVSPRIAAWQERIAEEKVYAEKEARRAEAEKAADLAAWQQSRERAMARAVTPKVAEDSRARERAEAKQKARQIAAQRQRQIEGESVALGYAPEPNRARFNNIYSAMREMRGGD